MALLGLSRSLYSIAPEYGRRGAVTRLPLDRIRIDRTHMVGSIDPVNPAYTYKVEQIHGG